MAVLIDEYLVCDFKFYQLSPTFRHLLSGIYHHKFIKSGFYKLYLGNQNTLRLIAWIAMPILTSQRLLGYECVNKTHKQKKYYLLFVSILLILTVTFSVLPAKAQLCQGSLGDPVVNITFGGGATTGQPLSAVTTSYTFQAADCPNDGFYSIRSSTTNCFGNTWHSLSNDHTGDPNGYFMLVNASYQPSAFYVDTVKGLCNETTYEFAAWIVNLMKSESAIRPNITFTIETPSGTVLQKYDTGDIGVSSSPQWKQYGFYFTTPANSATIVLRMVNNASGGIGNDLGLDDITFRPCGPKIAVQMGAGITSKDICQDDKSSFDFSGSITTGYTNPSYQWQESKDNGATWGDIQGATSTTFKRLPTDTGTYLYRLAVAQGNNISSPSCRVVSNYLKIHVEGRFSPLATSNNARCEGDTLALYGANGGATYTWTGPAGFTSSVQNPVINRANASNSGKYIVSMVTNIGCRNKDSVEVVLHKRPVANAGRDVSICEGTSTTLQGSGGSSYAWSPSNTLSSPNSATTIATPSDTTLYVLTVKEEQCVNYDSITVFVHKKPTANAGPDQKLYEGEAIQLSGIAGGTGVSFFWAPPYKMSSNTTLNPVVTPDFNFTYALNVASELGCGMATDSVFIRVYKKITIPNAFSPNNDGINDTWVVGQLNTYPEASVSIFSRDGQKVYQGTGNSKAWEGRLNGKPLPVGTYYYVIDIKNGFKPFAGWVMILK